MIHVVPVDPASTFFPLGVMLLLFSFRFASLLLATLQTNSTMDDHQRGAQHEMEDGGIAEGHAGGLGEQHDGDEEWEDLPMRRHDDQTCSSSSAVVLPQQHAREAAAQQRDNGGGLRQRHPFRRNVAASSTTTSGTFRNGRSLAAEPSTRSLARPARKHRKEDPPLRRPRDSTNLVNHPLQHLAGNFARHWCRQIWNVDDDSGCWKVRAAIVCGAVGIVFQILYNLLYALLYPEQVWQTSLLLIAVGVPLWWFYGKAAVERWVRAMEQMSQRTDWWNHDHPLFLMLDTSQIRGVAALGLFVLPAILELRTLHFLIQILVSCRDASDGAATTSLLSMRMIGPTLLLMLVLAGGASVRVWKTKKSRATTEQPQTNAVETDSQIPTYVDFLDGLSPRAVSQFALYALYGIALGVVLFLPHQGGRRHIPVLAARFLLATAVLLYKSTTDDNNTVVSQTVHRALRLTVRDALQDLGTSVQQDEMLQLTMLRWLVDYWSSTTSSSSTDGSNSSFRAARPNNARSRQSASTSRPEVHPDLEWSELWSMLQVTTQQMSTEVEYLQRPQSHGEEEPTGATAAAAASTDSSGALDDVAVPPTAPSLTTPATTSSNYNSSSAASNGPHHQSSVDSVQDLQTMLASINIDEQAKPAVVAYKQSVEAFPPSHRTAFVLGLTRRSPAILLLFFYFLFGLIGLYYPASLVVMMTALLPFTLLEAWRIHLWVNACHKVARSGASEDGGGEEETVVSWLRLDTVDSMTILLMDENYCATSPQLPTLLLVWHNVLSSVSALEVGLTTARCVQTGVVAVDFAANMMSLVNFGFEVSEHGWLHGVTVVARELLHLHTTGTDLSKLSHGVSAPPGASYTSAAVSALRNSQTISRNFRALSEEDEAGRIVGPLLGLIPLLIGHGWLWGKEEQARIEQSQQSSVPATTVEIIELDSEPDHLCAGDDASSAAARVDTIADSLVGSVEGTPLSTNESSPTPIVSVVGKDEKQQDNVSSISQEIPAPSTTASEPFERTPVDPDTANAVDNSRHVKNVGMEMASRFDDESSAVVELLAQCSEHSLIEPSEKSTILENLANMSEKKHTSTSLAWVSGTKMTLKGLVAHHNSDNNDKNTNSAEMTVPSRLDGVILPKCDEGEEQRSANGSFGSWDEQDFEPIKFGSSVRGALSVSSDEASHGKTATCDGDGGDDNDDSDFEPLQSSENDPNLAGNTHPEQEEPRSTAASSSAVALSCSPDSAVQDGEEENLWLKIGGSLAVVGAVVGGVAIAAAQSNGGKDQERRKRNRDESS